MGNEVRKGIRLLTLSLIPRLASKAGSTVGKRSIDPSAPPPLCVMFSQRKFVYTMVDLRLGALAARDGNGIV